MNLDHSWNQRMTHRLRCIDWVGMLLVCLPLVLPNSILHGGALDKPVQAASRIQFEKHTFTVEDIHHPTWLTGKFFEGGLSDFAVVGLNSDHDATLDLYALEEGVWSSKKKVDFVTPPTFVDVARMDGVDRVILHAGRSISWVDPKSGAMHPILNVDQNYQKHPEQRMPSIDISRDLNGDGRDEILLPVSDRVEIYIQDEHGEFSHSLSLGPVKSFKKQKASKGETHSNSRSLELKTIPWYLNRVQSVDFNRDGKKDVVFLKSDHLYVHVQNEQGQFDSKPLEVKSNVGFHPDSLIARFSEQKGSPFWGHFLGWKPRTSWKSFMSLSDLNGDTVPDFLTKTTEGRSFVNLRSSLEIHWGEANGDTIQFHADPNETIQPEESHPLEYASHQWIDLDQDGKMELVVTTVDTGLGDMFEALVASSIDQFIEVYHLQRGSYGSEPTLKRKIQPDSHLFKRKGPFFPGLLFGDCNADGHVDLVAGHDWDELHVFTGVPAPEFFSKEPISIQVDLPANEHQIRLLDLNHDNKQDVFMHRKIQEGDQEVTLLMAQ